MKPFLWNIALAFVWVTVTSTFTLENLAFGGVMGFVLLLGIRRALGETTYFEKPWVALKFALFMLKEILVCNLRVAMEVLTPQHHMKPAIIAVPLDVTTDAAITLLANMLTLTPGTCSLDVSDDRKTLYVHAMYVDNADELRASIKREYEARVLELLR
jgi:multicomponent Na+:H+ antiporter subunit E